MSYFDIRLAEKARNFTHDKAVGNNHLQNEFGILGSSSMHSRRRVQDDLAAWSGKTDSLAQESSGVGNMADNGVGQH